VRVSSLVIVVFVLGYVLSVLVGGEISSFGGGAGVLVLIERLGLIGAIVITMLVGLFSLDNLERELRKELVSNVTAIRNSNVDSVGALVGRIRIPRK